MSMIMLLYDKPSLLHRSMASQLREMGHEVYDCELQVEYISKCETTPNVIFVYADEDLEDNISALIYLKDYATEKEAPIFYAGDDEQTGLLENYIPKRLLNTKYLRPINVKTIASDINRYVTLNSGKVTKKILVVDDSGAMLRNMKGLLEPMYKVIPANSATMAIKYLATDRPDLILLDYEMPIINGKQTLEMIRSEHEFQDLPVIFLTNKGDKESVLEVMALKPSGYLLKSMPPEEILANINEFFEKQKINKLR